MKKIKRILIVLCCLFLTACSTRQVQNNESTQIKTDAKTLIVYYSYSGTTQRVARHLQNLTGGTLYEITLKKPYTGSSNDVSDRVFKERDDQKMPELKGNLPDLSKYDTIYIGTPVWNDRLSNPVLSYLQQVDFQNKTVYPFWTYITNEGSSEDDYKQLTKNASLKEGLGLASASSMTNKELNKKLTQWINQ